MSRPRASPHPVRVRSARARLCVTSPPDSESPSVHDWPGRGPPGPGAASLTPTVRTAEPGRARARPPPGPELVQPPLGLSDWRSHSGSAWPGQSLVTNLKSPRLPWTVAPLPPRRPQARPGIVEQLAKLALTVTARNFTASESSPSH